MAEKKHLFSTTGFWAHKCLSATVENGTKTDIVCTFTSLKPFSKAIAGEFTSTGTNRTCSSIAKNNTTHVLTLTMNSAYANGNSITLVYNPTGKGATITKTVTNNIP
jgi:hypothetical protein